MRLTPALITLTALLLMPDTHAREIVTLANDTAVVAIDLGGGSISSFHLNGSDLNPLDFDTWVFSPEPDAPPPADPRGFGHFLCLDRWGRGTEAEAANGMPIHGEASNVWWSVVDNSPSTDGNSRLRLTADLPLAGMKVDREMVFMGESACIRVSETVTSVRLLGRIYNFVQHPSIAAPFVDANTMVDCNGTRGFMQSTPMPNPEVPEVRWPIGLNEDGSAVDLRRLDGKPVPWVVTFIIEESFGWVTAANPEKGLMIGYLWPTADYPWFSLWSHLIDEEPAFRALEFGTTGMHRPEPDLLEKGEIFGRRLFRHIDAGESQTFTYAAFLAEIPSDYKGTAHVSAANGTLSIRERGDHSRIIQLDTGPLFPTSD